MFKIPQHNRFVVQLFDRIGVTVLALVHNLLFERNDRVGHYKATKENSLWLLFGKEICFAVLGTRMSWLKETTGTTKDTYLTRPRAIPILTRFLPNHNSFQLGIGIAQLLKFG